MGRIFNVALENVLLEEITIPTTLNGQGIYLDSLSEEFNRINTLSTAIEEGLLEIEKLNSVYKTNSSLVNIGGLTEERRVTISYESINEANNNLFGETKHYRNTRNLSIAQEDLGSTINYILEKIKDIFIRVITWFKKLWIRLSVWWRDHDKKLKEITDRIIKVTGDRVMLVQEETLVKLEHLYNLYLNIYKHNSTSVSLSDLISFSNVSEIFSQFTDVKHKRLMDDIIEFYPKFWSTGSLNDFEKLEKSDMVIRKIAKNKKRGIADNIARIIYSMPVNKENDTSLDIYSCIVYGLRENKIKTYAVDVKRNEFSCTKMALDINEGIVDMDYDSGVRIVDPSINKEVIENLYKSIAEQEMPLLKRYINDVLKLHDEIKKQITLMVKNVDRDNISEHNKDAVDNINREFNVGAMRMSAFLGARLPVEICLSVLDNVKLINNTFKLIYKDLSQRELIFEEIIAQVNESWKTNTAKVECLLGMKEFPYITVPYEVWKTRIPPNITAMCARLSSKFLLSDTMFGIITKTYFNYINSIIKHGKYVEPMVLFYNPEAAKQGIELDYKETGILLPEHFIYFHELGHALLDQTYGMQLANIYGAADSKKIKANAYSSGGSDYILSEIEIEANLFACLMTGFPVEEYIRFEGIRYGEEIGARYEKIVKKKLPYIERMIPAKFRLFSSLKR